MVNNQSRATVATSQPSGTMHINWTAFDGTAIRGLGATIGGIIVGSIAIGLAVCGHFFSVIPQVGPIAILIMMLLGCCIGFLYVDHKKSRADRIKTKLITGNRADGLELAWAAVGYTVIFGLLVTLVGVLLLFVMPDWRPLLIADAGMLFVVIALWYGQNLEQR